MTKIVTKKKITLYTDGACSGNPGPGGWGVFMSWNGHEKELNGGDPDTTNNRMELMAAIKGLEALKGSCHVDIYTDSKYVMMGITDWMEGWKRKGWKSASKKPIKNKDLWEPLDELIQKHDVHFYWVKGHSGDVGNDRADQLARDGILKI